MVLSNIEIKKAIEEGLIVIDPEPNFDDMDTTAIDLRLGRLISIPKKDVQHVIIYPQRKKGIASTLSALYERKELKKEETYILDPGKFVLGQTLERISLRLSSNGECYAARVEGKSSLARCGLIVHFTAPTIHAGFSGPITLEIINLGAFPIALQFEMPICQLIFEPVKGIVEKTETQFHEQITPEGLKSEEN